ncbi:lysosomal acid phosphatase isoform X2 [Nerophis ophidion]|uniref:lysosomal acid phosphatase isoform X2 n=1 Tax=Nerophis ophidion TaxID=159077 RepID=UPI002ADF5CFE|nr:lysosomal acid phosphatase isoform X2 [Nerophis ophidion]
MDQSAVKRTWIPTTCQPACLAAVDSPETLRVKTPVETPFRLSDIPRGLMAAVNTKCLREKPRNQAHSCFLNSCCRTTNNPMISLLFRHGDRSPVRAYPTDPYQERAWPQGFGQLSQEGMRQHLELGQFLRKRYKGFINDSYARHEITVRSTDYDRTLMSAEANLAGFYPPTDQQVFSPNLNWQPIPVHTVPKSQEKLLSFPLEDCPRYKILMNETEHTEEFINVTSANKDLIELVRNKTGLNKTNVESVWSVYDTLFCESRHNMSAPDWVTPSVMEKLRFLKDFGFRVIFGIYKQQEKNRLQGGLLLGEIVKNISKAAISKETHRLKMMMLSAHDTTVTALQASLNVFNGRQPPYASCHMIELYKDENGSLSVSMFYRNDSTVAPYAVQLPGCAIDCPLKDFVKLTQLSISNDRNKECQVPSSGSNKEVIITLAVSGCLLLLLVIVLFVSIVRHKEPLSNQGYHHVINQDAGEES